MRSLLIYLFLSFFFTNVFGQRLDRQLIVEWKTDGVGDGISKLYTSLITKAVSDKAGIDLLQFGNEETTAEVFQKLRKDPRVASVQYNYRVSFRGRPDDPRYGSEQGNLARAGFERAWDLSAGGTTVEEDEIVIAILDAGYDLRHEDIANSLWRNPAELPGDGVDNDGNGLVDDIHGWNYNNGTAAYRISTHGTQVMGLIGAEGNNGIGISGTNWRSKLMLFDINTVAEIVAAYDYILEQRTLYNESNGAQGAFVVATNASFGVEGATCDEFPVWGAMYEKLGRAGVLTAASTSNRPWNVDIEGDMPTDCTTDFLIGVANLGTDDRLFTSSGFGQMSVDLAAPGEGSYSLRPRNSYGSFGGTSAAAPYVAGAIALLYATPCPSLVAATRRNPAEAALRVRQALLASVAPNSSLEFRSVTGGSIDVAAAQAMLFESCEEYSTSSELTIDRLYPNPTDGEIILEIPQLSIGEAAYLELYDALGRQVTSRPLERVDGGGKLRLRASVAGLSAGWYLLRLVDRERSAQRAIIVR